MDSLRSKAAALFIAGTLATGSVAAQEPQGLPITETEIQQINVILAQCGQGGSLSAEEAEEKIYEVLEPKFIEYATEQFGEEYVGEAKKYARTEAEAQVERVCKPSVDGENILGM